MNHSKELRAWKCRRLVVASSLLSVFHRTGMAVALSAALMVAACSKKKDGDDPKPKAVVSAAQPAPPAVQLAPVEKKGPPIVTPGHLPPNPRMPSGSMFTSNVAVRHRRSVSPPQVQPAPAGESSGKGAVPAVSMPVVVVNTPEHSNQARQRALEEMFRLRSQKEAVPPVPVSPPTTKSEEKSAPTKNQP